MLAALCCVATMIIKIPSPLKGYLNLGDCVVLLSGWLLGPAYGFAAAGIGSALADIFSGYVIYAPATFIIKGLMAIPPISEKSGDNLYFFQKIYQLSVDIMKKKYDNVKVDCVSMGMSGDFVDAIRCGSTMIRIGTAIFGPRNYL